MKTIINREYAGEKEAFAPLIGFKVVSVEDGPTTPVNETVIVREDPVATDLIQLDFRVFGTREQIMALRNYMIENQIKFGKVE